MSKKKEKKLRITLTRSVITSNKRHKATIKALGLNKMHQTVEQPANDAIRGMLHKVSHLVTVEEV